MSADKLIIDLNFKNIIIDERKPQPVDCQRMFELITKSVIDERTLRLIEIDALFKSIDYTTTLVGSAKLFYSLNSPIESLELIEAKQEALKEIENNTALAKGIEEYLQAYKQNEKHLFRILNAHYLSIFPYKELRLAIKAVDVMVNTINKIPQPKSQYLDSLVKIIKNFGESPTYQVAKGPCFRTFKGIKARSEKTFFTPSLRFRRGRLSGGTVLPALPSLFFATAGLTGLISAATAKLMVILTGAGIFFGLIYGIFIKPIFDNETGILPLRKRLLDSVRFASAVEAVASIDEIFSFKTLRENFKYPTVIPKITNFERHYLIAEQLRNPVTAKIKDEFVANDIQLDGVGVTFITGPNSGGKTTYCKTIAQNQLLAQIGAPVIAKNAQLNIADKIAYQAPTFDTLNDVEGRFGTELINLRNIFFSTTPKSLIFLDEIAEGTTTHERLKLSISILDGFIAKYNNTVLVTHSYELADAFRSLGKGQFLQVEFKNDKPTYRLFPGISRDSQAHRVALKIGFSEEDIRLHLEENGYIFKSG